MLIDTLRADQLTARKNKNTTEAALLTTLISEASMVGKDDGNRDSTEAEVLNKVRKFVKDARDARQMVVDRGGNAEAVTKLDAEIAILERYLPRQLSQKELTRVIEEIVAAKPGAQMKDVMAALSRDHKGTYDGKTANGIATQVIKQAAEG